MKPDPLNRAVAERVKQLPEAEIRRLVNSAYARQAFAAATAKLSHPDQRKDSK
jgi:hypothetical protein